MSKANTAAKTLTQTAATKRGDQSTKWKCPLESTLAYRYEDLWKTSIHQFAEFDAKRAGIGGFVTGKPEYLIGGKGQTEAARAAGGENENNYDARIYSHFSAEATRAVVGRPSAADKEGHNRQKADKRRFLARALELEVYLYLDSLRFWTLATFDSEWPRPKDNKARPEKFHEADFSDAAFLTPSRSQDATSHAQLRLWLEQKRGHWSVVLTKRQSATELVSAAHPTESEPPPSQHHSLSAGWWDNREQLHQIFDALASGKVHDIESKLHSLVSIVPKCPNFLRLKLPGPDSQNPNTFWAEGLCETVRETTLVTTAFPQLMEALVCNIPARVWSIASPETNDMLLRIMARVATSLIYKLNAQIDFNPDRSQVKLFKALLPRFELPLAGVLPPHLLDIHELIERIENINDLIALHAAALHDCFTAGPQFFIKPGTSVNLTPRAVDGARPPTPTPVLCFRPPGALKQNKNSCTPDKCKTCRTNACAIIPCRNNECRDKTVAHREFMRQLREQQATLNGTRREAIKSNRETVGSDKPKVGKRSKSSSLQTTADSAPEPAPEQSQAPTKSDKEQKVSGTALVREEQAQKNARKTWHEERTKELLAAARRKHSEDNGSNMESWNEETGRAEAEGQATRELGENLAQRLSSRIKALKKQKPGVSEEDLVTALLSDEDLLEFARHIANLEGLTKEDIARLRDSKASRCKGLAALHALDIFAGGNAFQLLGLGDARVNSSIGGQWTANAKRIALNKGLLAGREYPNIELVVCPPKCTFNEPQTESTTP